MKLRTFACATALCAVALSSGFSVASPQSASPTTLHLADVTGLIGPLGAKIVADPIHAADVARATAAPFTAAGSSAGAQLRAQALSLGITLSAPQPAITQDLSVALSQAASFAGTTVAPAQSDSVPPLVRAALADILSATAASATQRAAALRALTPADIAMLEAGTPQLLPVQSDTRAMSFIAGTSKESLKPFAARKALLSKIDLTALLNASARVADAVDRARTMLRPRGQGKARAGELLRQPTPFGDLVVKGPSNDTTSENNFVVVDLGGNDTYSGTIASATGDPLPLANDLLVAVLTIASGGTPAPPPVAHIIAATQTRIVLDLGGRDVYSGGSATQGYGALDGVGILVDAGTDPDSYTGADLAQGAGFLGGVGMLIDSGGENIYNALMKTQGFSQAGGIGLLASGSGNDSYSAYVFSQGTGFDGGAAATLADAGGDDTYNCTGEVDSAAAVLPVSQSRPSTGCHGTGFGGQGLLVDGGGNDHYLVRTSFQAMSLIGGGALVDSGGTDDFDAGEWSNSIAVLGGSVLAEGSGNTRYFSNQRTPSNTYWIDTYLGSNGEGYEGVAALSDAGGTDSFTSIADKARPAPQFACGIGCAYLGGVGILSEGDGNDTYSTEIGEGGSIGGYAILFDRSGNDVYSLTNASVSGQGFGGTIAGGLLTCGVGYLVDEAGTDSYSNPVTTFGTRGDDRRWEQGDYGRGMDGQAGIVAYVQQKAVADIHTYVQKYACEGVLPGPIGIP